MGTIRGDGVPRCTVVIPTFEREQKLCRAIESARLQTEACDVIVADGGDMGCDGWGWPARDVEYYAHVPDNPGPSNLSWYVGANLVKTEYMAFLYDDDWYEPTFIARLCDMLDDGCGFAFSNARLVGHPDKEFNLGEMPEGNTLATGEYIVDMLRKMPLTISPGCCVFRTKAVLDHLRVSRIPGCRNNRSLVGPDKLLLLLAAAESTHVGIVPDPLVNFDCHEDSTTIKAASTDEGKQLLVDDYARATRYFDLLLRGDNDAANA